MSMDRNSGVAVTDVSIVPFLAVFVIAAAVLFATFAVSGPTPAHQASTHCATLDAIAVQTPEGWTCITASVIPADSATESVTEP